MTGTRKTLWLKTLRDESGQVIPMMVLVSILFLGMAGLSVDLGQAYTAYRELQASTDAAALAAGFAMGQANATQTTTNCAIYEYSSAVTSTTACGGKTVTGYNVNSNLPSATVLAPSYSCVNNGYTTGVYCSAGPSGCTSAGTATGCNVVAVTQTAVVPTIFIRALQLFHVSVAQSLTLSATATALMRGSASAQYNVAVVLDSTGSMSSSDTDNPTCKSAGLTKEQCALTGIQTLLSGLTPCGPGSSSSSCASAFDSVALFTFPNVEAETADYATTCPAPAPVKGEPTKLTGAAYSAIVPGTTWSTPSGTAPNYEITSGFLDNYSSTNAYGGSIATTSPIGIATGADTCTGLKTPISGEGTYLPGAIYAAQSALMAAQKANPGSENALIILTDGDANATNPLTDSSGNVLTSKTSPPLGTGGAYPSLTDQCQQAIGAAQYASNNGTSVYVVAYQASTSGCTYDAKAYQDPCTNLQAMALNANESSPYTPYAANFYSDATTANKGACTSSANPDLTLSQVFTQVATSFTTARLLPN